jgi:hypothetical protein
MEGEDSMEDLDHTLNFETVDAIRHRAPCVRLFARAREPLLPRLREPSFASLDETLPRALMTCRDVSRHATPRLQWEIRSGGSRRFRDAVPEQRKSPA